MNFTQVKTSAFLEQTIAIGLLVVMVFTVLAHGAVEPWSVLLFELLMTVLMLLWATKVLIDKKLILIVPHTVWPLVALLALGLVQSISVTGADGFQKSLSLDVEATHNVVLIIICLIAGILIAGNFWVSHHRLELLAKWLTFYGLALAIFAIIQHLTWNERFYWLRWNASYAPFGPFVNRNHFAGYMELLLPWPVAMMLRRWGHWQELLFYGLAAAWIGVAAILTLSRGGMISILAELMLIVVLSLRLTHYRSKHTPHSSRKGRTLLLQFAAIVVILATIMSGVLWLSGQRIINRITTGQETEGNVALPAQTFAGSRGVFWLASWTIFQANALTGVGLGAYETAFSIYGGEKIVGGQAVVDRAHIDYLQSLTDGGIIGGLIVLWFLIVLWRAAKRGLQLADPLRQTVALACVVSLFGLLVHSLFDYNLQLPSHSLLFVSYAAILGQLSTLAIEATPVPGPSLVAEGVGNLHRSLQ